MGKNNDHTIKQGIKRRREIMGVIYEFFQRNRYWPNVITITREINEISPQAVWKHVDKMHQMGLVKYEYGKDGKVELK